MTDNQIEQRLAESKNVDGSYEWSIFEELFEHGVRIEFIGDKMSWTRIER